jgi:hypothetical protein
MSGVWRLPKYCTPPPLVRGRTHSLGREGGQYFGRHCSVLYIRKYFVRHTFEVGLIFWKGKILFSVLDIGHHTDCFKL